jgi:hypothetical protein
MFNMVFSYDYIQGCFVVVGHGTGCAGVVVDNEEGWIDG